VDSPRSDLRAATRPDLDTSAIIAMRIAIQATACETSTTRREHFVWPTNVRRRPFYWYAVEAVAADEDDRGYLPVIVEADGFERTEGRAHAVAERAFDDRGLARAFKALRYWIEDHR
jgi:hypothetical protein